MYKILCSIKNKDINSKDIRDFSLNTDYPLWKIILSEVLLNTAYVEIKSSGLGICYVRDAITGAWRFVTDNFMVENWSAYPDATDNRKIDHWIYVSSLGNMDITYFITVDDV